ncbi:MAG: hypothetical protein HDT25_02735 [Ruminococcus sp.]|nr:hypothetical protein [Ruminococcus sp.]
MSEKSSKAPYVIVNLTGAILAILIASNTIFELFGFIIFAGYGILISFIGEQGVLFLLFIINILSCVFVTINKPPAGVALSVFWGSIGALVGVYFNDEYKYTKIAKVSLNAHIWVFILLLITRSVVG